MKLKITGVEAAEIIRKHFNLPANSEVVITKVSSRITNEIAKFVERFEALHYLGSEKIPAIKLYREATNVGLAESKWAVEHWPAVKKFLLKYGKFPSINVYNENPMEI